MTENENLSLPRRYAAFDALRSEILGVDPKTFVRLKVDIQASVRGVFGRQRKLKRIHPELANLMGEGFVIVEKLETYAFAALHAQMLYVAAAEPPDDAARLAGELIEKRASLLSDAKALATRRLLDGALLKQLKGTRGYKNLVFDTMLLTRIFRASWPAVELKTVATLAELKEANAIAERLANAVGSLDSPPKNIADAHRMRQAAFTLFARAYEEVRRAVTHVRWFVGDADDIAPSLYKKRRRRPARKDRRLIQ